MQLNHSALCLAPLAALLATPAQAEDWLHWTDNSLTYLYGQDFTISPEIQQTVTFEHANGWKYGDTFLFIDSIHYNGETDDDSSFYGEFSPRFSFGRLLGQDLSFGPVKDVLLATTYEFGEGDVESYLIGPGFSLAIPGFDFFNLNFYRREADGDRDGDGVWQVTPNWAITIPVGNSDIRIDGFMDWVVDNDEGYHSNLHFNPQIKYDLGKALNWGEKQLYVGIEYDYWKDKYGIDDDSFLGDEVLGGTDQNTASLLVKVHF
ncbi:hypothetical protein JQR85_15295 [Stutzerimonas urumqiensis]|uniref:outer membrane protein OmpK n=1 Tax=Stutzerimonas urumqiensis TaxID=638269 RepID=UPI003DA6C725